MSLAEQLQKRSLLKTQKGRQQLSSEILSFGFGGFGQLNQLSSMDISDARPMLDLVSYGGERDAASSTYSRGGDDMMDTDEDDDNDELLSELKHQRNHSNVVQSHQVQTIAPSLWHTLFLTTDGVVFASGRNRYGACGLDSIERMYTTKAHRSKIDAPVSLIAAGKYHSMLVTQDQRIMVCGLGCYPGNNSALYPEWADITSQFPPRGTFKDIKCGEFHSLVVMDVGAFAWGRESRLVAPVELPKNCGALKKGEVGAMHGVLLTETGRLFAYGANENRQCSTEKISYISQFDPVEIPVPPLDDEEEKKGDNSSSTLDSRRNYWRDVVCGEKHVLALDSKNRLYFFGTWFTNTVGRHDYKYSTPRLQLPSDLPPSDIKQLVSTQSTFGLLTRSGRLLLAGNASYGTLGTGKTSQDSPTLKYVDSLMGFQIGQVYSGGHSLFLRLSSSALIDIDKMRTYRIEDTYDTVLVSGSGETRVEVKAHRCVLAARSDILADRIVKKESDSGDSPLVIDVSDLIHGSVLSFMLEVIYGNLSYGIPHVFYEHTKNAVEKLKLRDVTALRTSLSGNPDSFKRDMERLVNCANNWEHYSNGGMDDAMDEDESDQNSQARFFADVTFVLDDQDAPEDCQRNEDGDPVLHAHRIILAARSVYFAKMFYGSMMESQRKVIPLIDSNYLGFKTLLHLFYTNDFSVLSPETAVELLEYAIRFDWKDLKHQATEIIVEHIDEENVFDILQVGDILQSVPLLQHSIMMIAERAHLQQSEKFTQLSEENQERIKKLAKKKATISAGKRTGTGSENEALLHELMSTANQSDRELLAQVQGENDANRVNRILRNGGSESGCCIS